MFYGFLEELPIEQMTYMLLFRWANIGTIQYNKSPVESFYMRLCTLGDEVESE